MKRGASLGIYVCQSSLPLPVKCLPLFCLDCFLTIGTQPGSSKFFLDTHKSLHKTPVQSE